MAVCLLNKSLTKATVCGYSLPQIVSIYLCNFGDVTATELTKGESGAEIASITLTDQAKWYKIEPSKNSASWSDNLAVGASFNKYKIHNLTFSFNGQYDGAMVDTVDAFALGRYLAVLAMADGSHILLGRNVGLEASDADNVTMTGSGEAGGEGGLTVVLSANTTESAIPMTEEAVTAMKENVA